MKPLIEVARDNVTRSVFMLLICATISLNAENKSGFVTNVETPTEFDIGGNHVVLSDTTECEVETLDEEIVLKRNIYDGVRAHMHLVPRDDLVPTSLISTPCKGLRVHVGTRITLAGELSATGVLTARNAVKYIVRNHKILSILQNTITLRGGAIIEEAPDVHYSTQGWTGSMWLDGYPISIGPKTNLSGAPADSKLLYGFRGFTRHPRFQVEPSSACASHSVSAGLFRPNIWAMYEGAHATNGNIIATQLCLWPNEINSDGTNKGNKKKFLRVNSPNYQLQIRGSIEMPHKKHLDIIADQWLQDWLSRLGWEIVPQSQKALPDSDPAKIHFHFYVIHGPDSTLQYVGDLTKGRIYGMKRPGFDDAAIAMPDGLVVVRDSSLARIDNTAQLAAILSYAVTFTLQKQASVRYYSVGHLGEGYGPSFTPYALTVLQDEQLLRIGIRQMYLAGYDIREAPYAWAVAQGKPVQNPIINSKHPDQEIPWYAAYAFNYISQYYKDVDYSKLKRGETEYQQFLQELRKADPEAFAPTPPKHAQK